jgi:hypothetical protein
MRLTVPTIHDTDGRRPDTTARSWRLVADHGDTMTIEVDDTEALVERVATLEAALAARGVVAESDLSAARVALREPVQLDRRTVTS